MSNVSHDSTSLWQQLLRQGLVDEAEMPESSLVTPWYIVVAQVLAGWFAGVFLLLVVLSFIALLVEHFTSLQGLVLGVVLVVASFAYYHYKPRKQANEFVHQLIFAINICGQLMVCWWLFDNFWASDHYRLLTYVGMGILFAIHWRFIDYQTNQFIAAMGVVSCAIAILYRTELIALVMPLLILLLVFGWFNQCRWPRHYGRMRVMGYVLALAGLWLGLTTPIALQFIDPLRFIEPLMLMGVVEQKLVQYLAILIVFIAVGWFIKMVFAEGQYPLSKPVNIGCWLGGLLLCLLYMLMPGLAFGTLLLLIGFYHNERKLQAMAILIIVLFISQYYYFSHLDLLHKSLYLIASGISLLAVRVILPRWLDYENSKELRR